MSPNTEDSKANPQLILPVGTKVVSRIDIFAKDGELRRARGAVGHIIKSPLDATHTYLIRFPDGAEVPLHRHELSILKQTQTDDFVELRESAFGHLQEYVIYKCVIGSRAYGLDNQSSDTDIRGIYLPPADLQWSLYGVPELLDNPSTDECYFELQRFIVLALKSNPSILECLYTPVVEFSTPLADELLASKGMFISRLVYQTYNGYVLSQFKKLEQDLRVHNHIKWKHAMHLIRLLLAGVTALKEGYVPVKVEEHKERLLAVRRGEVPWTEVDGWRLELHRQFDRALAESSLPERPDYEAANRFLIHARRSMTK